MIDAISAYLRWPVEAWPTSSFELAAADSPEALAEEARRWVEYVEQNAPLFVEPAVSLGRIKSLIVPGQGSFDQLVSLIHLLGRVGHTGYPSMSIRPLRLAHQINRSYRNEWFHLTGTVADGTFFSWSMQRTTVAPASGRSLMRFRTSFGTQTETSPWVPEEWGLVTLADGRLELKANRMVWIPKQADSFFPAFFRWRLPNSDRWLSLTMTKSKPMCMFKSNGAVFCAEGLGLKKTMYPLVVGTGTLTGPENEVKPVEFSGTFGHEWESGLAPEGFPMSATLQSLEHILDSTGPTNDRFWTAVCIMDGLTNEQTMMYFFPEVHEPAGHPYAAVTVLKNGSLLKVPMNRHAVYRDGPDHEYRNQRTGRSVRWSCEHAVPGETAWYQCKSATPGCRIFMQTMKTPSQDQLLASFDQVQSYRFKRSLADSSTTSNSRTTHLAYLVWLVPLVLVISIFLVALYLVWHRGQRKRLPWEVHAEVRKRLQLF